MTEVDWIEESGHRGGAAGTAGMALLLGAFLALSVWCMGGVLRQWGLAGLEGIWAYPVTMALGAAAFVFTRWVQDRPALSEQDAELVARFPWNASGRAELAKAKFVGCRLTYGMVRRAARAHVAAQLSLENSSNRRAKCLALDSMLNAPAHECSTKSDPRSPS